MCCWPQVTCILSPVPCAARMASGNTENVFGPGSSLSSSSFARPSRIGCAGPCAPQVPQRGCRLQSAAEGGYVCTRQRGPFSSLRSFQHRQEPQWVVTLQVQSLTPASGKTWQSTRASTVVWDVPLDGRVTLRLFSVTQEDVEVQRDDGGSDKTVEA